MARPGIMSKTKAADVSIQAVAPESIAGPSAADKAVGIVIIPVKIKRERRVIFISNEQRV
jgi:hypothetical protein